MTHGIKIDGARLEAFAGKVMTDIGGAMSLLLAYIGDQTGVYRALRDAGPSTAEELAEKAGVDARYLTEWLGGQAAAGYVTYDAASERFSLSREHAVVLAQEGHPACMQGFLQLLTAQFTTHDQAVETFRSGAARNWSDHHSCCFCGTDRFIRPGYTANLIASWLPSLDGVMGKLRRGARLADVGCGLGPRPC